MSNISTMKSIILSQVLKKNSSPFQEVEYIKGSFSWMLNSGIKKRPNWMDSVIFAKRIIFKFQKATTTKQDLCWGFSRVKNGNTTRLLLQFKSMPNGLKTRIHCNSIQLKTCCKRVLSMGLKEIFQWDLSSSFNVEWF